MFCLQCGKPLGVRFIDSRERYVCFDCGWVFYQQLKVSSAVIIEKENKILLLKRAFDPWKEFWYLPAGYVECDEDPRLAGVREVQEEIGIKINIGKLFSEYYFDDDPRGNGLLLVYFSTVLDWNVIPSTEITAYQYFLPNQLPEKLCGAGHRTAIQEWALLKNG